MAGRLAAAGASAATARGHRDIGAAAGPSAGVVHVARDPAPGEARGWAERVFGEWWKADPELVAVRDYFRVEDDAGERFWIFRAGDGENAATGSQRWYLHGIFA